MPNVSKEKPAFISNHSHSLHDLFFKSNLGFWPELKLLNFGGKVGTQVA